MSDTYDIPFAFDRMPSTPQELDHHVADEIGRFCLERGLEFLNVVGARQRPEQFYSYIVRITARSRI